VRKVKFKSLSSQRGYLVMLIVIMIIIVGFIGAAITNMFFGSTFSTTAHYKSDNALYLAEAGLEHATHKLLTSTVANRLSCTSYGSGALTNTLGSGSYSVTASASLPSPYAHTYYYAYPFNAPTTLTATITNASTSIPVASTTDYAPAGRIMIDKERINYEGTTATRFTNVTRGVDNTVAVSHASGASIGQFQCNLTSQGGVPDLSTPQGKRTVQAGVQMQEAFAVGDATSGGASTIAIFNYPTELTWNALAAVGNINLFAVYFNSYVDGWFAGNNKMIHWNGNATTAYTPPININYRSVYCTASNDCHAVGDATGGRLANNASIIRWTGGANWTRATPTGTTAGNNMASVHCDSSNDCWAVGDNGSASYSGGLGQLFNGLSSFYNGQGSFFNGLGSLFQGYNFYHWNGAGWTGVVQTALQSAFPFTGVYCNSATDCWTVGSTNTFGHLAGGTTFTAVVTSLPNTYYNAVYCNSTSDCWAVGVVNTTNLFVHWNGSTWSRDPSTPTPLANLTSVACTGTNDCWAVGSSRSSNAPQFYHWDGSSWTTNTNITGSLSPSTLRSVAIVGGGTTPSISSTQPMTNWTEIFS
jgi:Tfp pilus assembly protein PilX